MLQTFILFNSSGSSMEVINGVLFHAAGASSASLCYTPQKKVKGWSWQTYWLAQAAVCWFILPLIIAAVTIPQLITVLKEAPSASMFNSFFLGMAYGVGGTAFGIAIRFVGFSLTYAVSVGISCILGTLLPPIMNGTIAGILLSNGVTYLFGGIFMGVLGIAFSGLAGRSKEKDIAKKEQSQTSFSLAKGLPLCLLAGILSAFYGFSFNHGQPIADVAAKYGAGNYQGNVIYIFSNTGAFISTLVYCLYLHRKEKSMREYRFVGGKGLGHVRMGKYDFSSWAIHMMMLVLLSTITGFVLKEWKYCSRKTMRLLLGTIVILIVAVLLLTQANRLGNTV